MQEDSTRRSNETRTIQMRARLIAAARALFVAKGYGDTSTPDIVAAAGVTRGALYHHFPDKAAMFRAVLEHEAAQVAAAIEAAGAPEGDALDGLLAGATVYLAAMAAPGRTRLLLVDGPAVLGPAAMREIEGRHGDATLETALAEAVCAGLLPPLPIGPLTALLSAMFERAALDLSGGQAAEDYLVAVRAILSGLATLAPGRTDTGPM